MNGDEKTRQRRFTAFLFTKPSKLDKDNLISYAAGYDILTW
jgi:hypothetical protein